MVYYWKKYKTNSYFPKSTCLKSPFANEDMLYGFKDILSITVSANCSSFLILSPIIILEKIKQLKIENINGF